MLKLLGCFLIGMASAGVTANICLDMREHLKLLYFIRGMLNDFFHEAEYSLSPMETILYNDSAIKEERLKKLCKVMAERLKQKQGQSGEDIWRKTFLEWQRQLGLRAEEVEIIADTGNAFFGKSMDENRKNFSMNMERLEFVIENIRGEQKEKQKVCQTMGIACGLMLIILLI